MMKKLTLTFKLLLLLLSLVLITSLTLGIYFDSFLKENFFESTQKRMYHGFHRLTDDINKVTENLKKGTAFIQNDENILASIDLINNYQDKADYNAILLDEEKKIIVGILYEKVRLALTNDIALYDQNEELIAYVTNEDNSYYLHFVSYENGKPVIYRKHENDVFFVKQDFQLHPRVVFQHKDYYNRQNVINKDVITRHMYGNELFIKSHHSIKEAGSPKTQAHVEMSCAIGPEYLRELSNNLDLPMTLVQQLPSGTKGNALLDLDDFGKTEVYQTEKDYISVASFETDSKPVYFVATLKKALLKNTLDENRQKLLVILLLVNGIAFFLLRLIFKRILSDPMKVLMKQIDRIEKGDYSDVKALQTGDELQSISSNIRTLSIAVKEREDDLQRSYETLKFISDHDPLTNLPNRRFLEVRLEHAIALSERNGTKAAVLFFDFDNFKQINDTLGHNIGDNLLKVVASRLKQKLRTTDTLVRIGGDEFIILMEEVSDIADIDAVVRKVFEDFRTPFVVGDDKISVTVSIGIAVYPDDGEESMTLIKHADLAMYQSKEKGRNQHTFFSKELSNQIEERMLCTQSLRVAIENFDEFFLLYQPKRALGSDGAMAIEALVRWDRPGIGLAQTEHFITLAEETQFIIPIGEWVLRQACQDFVRLQNEGYLLDHVSINVSSIQLNQSDFANTLKQVISETGIAPEKVELEITERYVATNTESALPTLHTIREMGIMLAIDDFGTGYSSMSYLQKLPVTRLKIDKSFIDDLPDSNEHLAITRAIIALAKTFGLKITAEGVETLEQMMLLNKEGCDEIQGYYYSKPLTLDKLITFYDAEMEDQPTVNIMK